MQGYLLDNRRITVYSTSVLALALQDLTEKQKCELKQWKSLVMIKCPSLT